MPEIDRVCPSRRAGTNTAVPGLVIVVVTSPVPMYVACADSCSVCDQPWLRLSTTQPRLPQPLAYVPAACAVVSTDAPYPSVSASVYENDPAPKLPELAR